MPRNFYTQPIDRRGCSDVQTLQIIIAKNEIRTLLGHLDHAERSGGRIKNVDPALGAAPDVALRVDLHAVGHAGSAAGGFGPDDAIGERPIELHVVAADVEAATVVNVELRFIERKAEPVRPSDLVGEQGKFARLRINAVDATEVHFALTRDAVNWAAARPRIGKVDRAITFDHDVVGAVEFASAIMGGDHFDAIIGEGVKRCWIPPRDPACAMFAGDDNGLRVERVSVSQVTVSAQLGCAAFAIILLFPAINRIPHDVAKDERLLLGMPDRAFGKVEAGGDLFELGIGRDKGGEGRVSLI